MIGIKWIERGLMQGLVGPLLLGIGVTLLHAQEEPLHYHEGVAEDYPYYGDESITDDYNGVDYHHNPEYQNTPEYPTPYETPYYTPYNPQINTPYYYRQSDGRNGSFSGDLNFGRRYDNSANFSTGVSSYQGTSTGPGPNGGYPGTPRGTYKTHYYDTSIYPNTYMRVYPY